ncbi:unnamed protein product [Leptidea sinapis]|uniref:Uncharacterized protein n=1 Tax=Leptidea sinapis TaxID=189913 RepID=A0A5E4QCZ0_9NEOP|nr:unnamed protein product [Leptidea sinapis]
MKLKQNAYDTENACVTKSLNELLHQRAVNMSAQSQSLALLTMNFVAQTTQSFELSIRYVESFVQDQAKILARSNLSHSNTRNNSITQAPYRSVNSEDTAKQISHDLIKIFKSGDSDHVKWCSNSSIILNCLPDLHLGPYSAVVIFGVSTTPPVDLIGSKAPAGSHWKNHVEARHLPSPCLSGITAPAAKLEYFMQQKTIPDNNVPSNSGRYIECYAVHISSWTFDYWKKKGIKHDPPAPFFGTNSKQFLQKASARLGLMQSMAGIAAILHKFDVEPSSETIRNPKPDPTGIVSENFAGGLPLKLRKRKCAM